MNDPERQRRARRARWRGWSVLVGYVLVLFLMARVYWHARLPFLFLGIFLLLTVLVILAFRILAWLESGSDDEK